MSGGGLSMCAVVVVIVVDSKGVEQPVARGNAEERRGTQLHALHALHAVTPWHPSPTILPL